MYQNKSDQTAMSTKRKALKKRVAYLLCHLSAFEDSIREWQYQSIWATFLRSLKPERE